VLPLTLLFACDCMNFDVWLKAADVSVPDTSLLDAAIDGSADASEDAQVCEELACGANGERCTEMGRQGTCIAGACCTGCVVSGACREPSGVVCGGGGVQCQSCVDTVESCGALACEPNAAWRMVDSSQQVTCGVDANGVARCFGVGVDAGGDARGGSIVTRPLPPYALGVAPIRNDVRFTTISSGYVGNPATGVFAQTTCGLDAEGHAYCFGSDHRGELGDGPGQNHTTVPVLVSTEERFTEIEVASNCVSALTADGRRFAWGLNGFGFDACGQSTQQDVPTATSAPEGVRFHGLKMGPTSGCAVTQSDQVYCFGSAIGGTDVHAGLIAPTELTEVSELDVGGSHACALARNGRELWCWASADGVQSARLGRPISEVDDYSRPFRIEAPLPDGASRWRSLSLGGTHGCVIADIELCPLHSELHCWGHDDFGQLDGQGTHSDLRPIDPSRRQRPVTRWESVSASEQHTCAVGDGRLYCWGTERRIGSAPSTLIASSP
jgi:alpha-tubulin suppressor-like RCC1 family protein